jgi:SAM-dependent methyltransferase
MNETGPSMFDAEVNFANITLLVDPIDRTRTEVSDNVMAMFYEEQPFMWEFVKDDISKAIKTSKGDIDFLDVGTGSGVWSILVAKNLGAQKIIAIDKSRRAIEEAKKNAERNNVLFSLQEEFYNMNSVPYRSVKSIGIYAPYHLYPKEMEMKIPQHARGGIDGQQIFREQLCTANYHLADEGSIVFNQMCLGRNGIPEFVQYIPHLLEDVSLKYTNIFPPMRTDEFLKGIYGDAAKDYQEKISKKYPELYYCDGVITRDSKCTIEEVAHDIDLKGRSWADRIELHRQIALHGLM